MIKIPNSLIHLSLENPDFFEFICLFDSINDPMHLIYWDCHYSRCFEDLVGLDAYQLKFLQDFLDFCEQNLSQDELELCQDNIQQGKADIAWLLDLDQFYQHLVKNFKNVLPLSKQENYFIKLLANKSWQMLASNDWLGFLQGYDFFYSSDMAYGVAVPACIKFCIDDFRNQTNNYPFGHLSILLEDNDRAKSANTDLKNLVMKFLQIWSHPACFVGEHELDKIYNIWR